MKQDETMRQWKGIFLVHDWLKIVKHTFLVLDHLATRRVHGVSSAKPVMPQRDIFGLIHWKRNDLSLRRNKNNSYSEGSAQAFSVSTAVIS